jgi:hypothetical protein
MAGLHQAIKSRGALGNLRCMNTTDRRAFVRSQRFLSVTLLTCGLLCLRSLRSEAASMGMEMEMAPFAKPTDLTGLSLQELYNLDIVQMNVLGAHTHPAGELMVGYQFMYMDMQGIRSGGHAISPAEVFAQGFTFAHIRMQTEDHMFDFMYAPSDELTLMAMLPYKTESMTHLTRTNTTFVQHGEGIGDLQVMGMYTVLGNIRKGGNRLVLDGGMGFPTGSTDVEDHQLGNPSLPLQKLEYPMQLGSGTFDLLPGVTYLGDAGRWEWGAQTIETVRLGRNGSGYRFGNVYWANAWGAYGVCEWFAPYLRAEGRVWGNVHGADPAYGPVPATAEARPDKQAGQRANAFLGFDIYIPKGVFMGSRFTVEAGVPFYQELTGPQLGLSWTINAGWTYTF